MKIPRNSSNSGGRGRAEQILPATRLRHRRPPVFVDPLTYVCTVLALGGAVLAQDALTALVRLLT